MYILGLEEEVRKVVPLQEITMPENPKAMPLFKTDHYLACGIENERGRIIAMMDDIQEIVAMIKTFAQKVKWYDLDAEAITEGLDQAPPKFHQALLHQWISPGAALEIVASHPARPVIITSAGKEGIATNGKRMILVFTSEDKAAEYMLAANLSNGYTMPMAWSDLVARYGRHFKYALIDPDYYGNWLAAARLK